MDIRCCPKINLADVVTQLLRCLSWRVAALWEWTRTEWVQHLVIGSSGLSLGPLRTRDNIRHLKIGGCSTRLLLCKVATRKRHESTTRGLSVQCSRGNNVATLHLVEISAGRGVHFNSEVPSWDSATCPTTVDLLHGPKEWKEGGETGDRVYLYLNWDVPIKLLRRTAEGLLCSVLYLRECWLNLCEPLLLVSTCPIHRGHISLGAA